MNRTILLGILLLAATTTIAPFAAAGGECNPGDIDRNCTYGEKKYYCSLWINYDCVADVSSQVVQ